MGSFVRGGARRARGFTLIELMIVMAVLIGISAMTVQKMKRDQDRLVAVNTGKQLRQVQDAVNAFVTDNIVQLGAAAQMGGAYTFTGFGGLTCAALPAGVGPTGLPLPAGMSCDMDAALSPLKGVGGALPGKAYLPATFSNAPLFNRTATWKVTLKVIGSNPSWIATGLVVSSAPWLGSSGQPAYDLLGAAVSSAGGDGGFSINNAFSTKGGVYQAALGSFASLTANGQLGARVGVGAASYTAYLRTDGTLPMVNTFDIGGQGIDGVGAAMSISGSAGVNNGLMALGSIQGIGGGAPGTSYVAINSVGQLILGNAMSAANTGAGPALLNPLRNIPANWAGSVGIGALAENALSSAYRGGIWAEGNIGAVDSVTGLPVAMLEGSSGRLYATHQIDVARVNGATQNSATTPYANGSSEPMPLIIGSATAPWGDAGNLNQYRLTNPTNKVDGAGNQVRAGGTGGYVSAGDVFIRKIGRWYSEIVSPLVERDVWFVGDGAGVPKPYCAVIGSNPGTPKIVLKPADQLWVTQLSYGGTVDIGGGNMVPYPGQYAYGETLLSATDVGTSWVVNSFSPTAPPDGRGPGAGGASTDTGYTVIAQTYCQYDFNPGH